IRQTQLHFREGNSDKIYEVDLCETAENQFVVNFRYGRRGADLKEGVKTTTPVAQAEAEKVFQKLVDEKTRKGYSAVSNTGDAPAEAKPKTALPLTVNATAREQYIIERLREAVQSLNKKYKWPLERVIWRAGELKIIEAAPFLVQLIGTGNALRDYCCAWSLGFCGDEDSLSTLSKLYNNPNTGDSTRRIAAAAMLKLADKFFDAEKRREYQIKAAEFLPVELKMLARNGTSASFATALRQHLEKTTRGSHTILEQIYELDNEIVRPALLTILREIPLKPRYFKPLRHIFKIAEYRRDAEVFGIIARRFETEKANFTYYVDWTWERNSAGKYVKVKRANGLNSEDSEFAFGAKTREYFIRRTWRSLRKMGEDKDSDYVKMAVGSLLPFSDADAQEVRTSTFYSYLDENGRWDWRNPQTQTITYDTFAPYLLFNHILYSNSPRYELKNASRAFRFKNPYQPGRPQPSAREEAFPEMWNAQPVGLLHLLAESNCLPVHEFAVKAMRDCREFCAKLDLEAVLMLLERPYEVTAELGFELAREHYDAANPNIDLVVAVAVCKNAEARAIARNWIDARRELFAKSGAALVRLLTCEFADTREFAANLLKTTNYSDDEAQVLIGRLISELISFDETRSEQAKDLSEAIFKSFGRQLRQLNLAIVRDLLSHKLVEVQEMGGNILLNHEISAENLPDELINSLVESPFETIRSIGIKLFGQLTDENLLRRESVILSLLMHELADVHNATRPIVARLSARNPDFTARLTNSIITALISHETHKGVHSRLLEVLKTEVPNWTKYANAEEARSLVKAVSPESNEAGGIILQTNADTWHEQFTTEEIIDLTNHEILSVRQASWALATSGLKRFLASDTSTAESEISFIVRALDAKWDDSREFWFGLFRNKLTAAELTPEILVAICDSVREPVQKFGRDLLLTYFKAENGAQYLLRLSEHPSVNMQLFVTNYLENYATDSPERIRQLAPYFVRVLSLVNRARTAKTRILALLEREALKNAETANTVAQILARQSATVAIGDKAATIQSMLKIRHKFPEIVLPIEIKETEVRRRDYAV
ncbi:MAG: WGR domain-containing protein, partial [Pyrinomonadaceae bacterium]